MFISTTIMNSIKEVPKTQYKITVEGQKDLFDNVQYPIIWANSILSIYDVRPEGTLYAPIGIDDDGELCWADTPKFLFDDQVEEIE